MKNQTALHWFAAQLGIQSGTLLEQAVEMEREQLVHAYWEGRVSLTRPQPTAITEFYSKNYKSKK